MDAKGTDHFSYQKCQEILGKLSKVQNFAAFFKDNIHEIDSVRDAIIVKFARSGDYSNPETVKGVIGALNEFSDFFAKCASETEKNRRVKEVKKTLDNNIM